MIFVAVINVDVYPFLTFSDKVFWLHCADYYQADSKKVATTRLESSKLRSSNHKASPSAGKNTGVVLGPCCTWKCVPTAISGGVNIPDISLMLFVTTDESSVRVKKIISSSGFL